MEEIIRSSLMEIEDREGVKVFYACESGSRAWGFPSADSDYDVRFLYVRPIEWYLSIDPKRDVIELPILKELDINGWDLKKALQLLRKSNPPLLEWLGSPIVYIQRDSATLRLRELAADYYSPTSCLYHYLHMARTNFREYLKDEQVWTKKYFYVLRPILAINWIENGLGVVPTDFNVLVDELVKETKLRLEIERLLAEKRAGAELDRGPKIPVISEFIEREIERWEQQRPVDSDPDHSRIDLDSFFRNVLAELWES